MATSSITANFEIKDTKTARAFVTALLSSSRPVKPPAVSRGWKLVSDVSEITHRRPRQRV